MTSRTVASIRDFVAEAEPVAATYLALNRTQPAPVLNILSTAFDRQPIPVADVDVTGPGSTMSSAWTSQASAPTPPWASWRTRSS